MSIIKTMKRLDKEDCKKCPKVLKVGVSLGVFGLILAAQQTALGRIAATVTNPILEVVGESGVIVGSSVVAGYTGFKMTRWIFAEELKEREKVLDEAIKKTDEELEALDA